LSCIAGQWYLVRTWRTITVSVIVVSEDAILFLFSGTSYLYFSGRTGVCVAPSRVRPSSRASLLSNPVLLLYFFRVIVFLSSNLSVS
jgi:hypothetical protein